MKSDDPHEIEQQLDQALGYPLAGPIATLRVRGEKDLPEALADCLFRARVAALAGYVKI